MARNKVLAKLASVEAKPIAHPDRIEPGPGVVSVVDRDQPGVTSPNYALGSGFVVDLDGGGRLIALEENGHSARHDDLRRGDAVELRWHREHLIEIHLGGPAPADRHASWRGRG